MKRNQKGQSLVELLFTVSMMGIIGILGVSGVGRAQRRVALASATAELRAIFQRVRLTAVAHNRNLAVRFRPEGDRWNWSVYEDRDGDGVRNDDIASGVDKLIERP